MLSVEKEISLIAMILSMSENSEHALARSTPTDSAYSDYSSLGAAAAMEAAAEARFETTWTQVKDVKAI